MRHEYPVLACFPLVSWPLLPTTPLALTALPRTPHVAPLLPAHHKKLLQANALLTQSLPNHDLLKRCCHSVATPCPLQRVCGSLFFCLLTSVIQGSARGSCKPEPSPQVCFIMFAFHTMLRLHTPRRPSTRLLRQSRNNATPSSPCPVTLMCHTQQSSRPSHIDPSHTSAFWQAPCTCVPSARLNAHFGPLLSNPCRRPCLREQILCFMLHSQTQPGGDGGWRIS
jgi:hypothetical protein